MAKKIITTIKGAPKTYKTTMLITVANCEAEKGHAVHYATGEENEQSLRKRGLDARVVVTRLTDPDHKDRLGRVESLHDGGDRPVTFVWRARQSKRED